MGARLEKRDTAETGDQTVTTESFLDTLKNGVKNTFSPENIEVSWNLCVNDDAVTCR